MPKRAVKLTTSYALRTLPWLVGACHDGAGPDTPATLAPVFPVAAESDAAPEMEADSAVTRPEDAPPDKAAQDGRDASRQADGLPCEVAAFLRTRCTSCHGAPPLPGVPMSLATYADLSLPSKLVPSLSYAERAIERMRMGTMPPGGALGEQDMRPFASWVAAGAMPDRCQEDVPDAGGSAAHDAGMDAAVVTVHDSGRMQDAEVAIDASPVEGGSGEAEAGDAAGEGAHDASTSDSEVLDGGTPATPSVCTSDSYWTRGDAGSALMSPGTPCLACHTAKVPVFTFAGTVYPSAHEPNDCDGTPANGATVLIKAANGYKLALTANSAGNFLTQTSLPKPYTVEILYQGRVRSKQQPQTSGDCNACHSESGAQGASGRLTLP